MLRALAAAALAIAALAACDAQTDAGYSGEPLVTLRGRVESQGQLPPLEAAMLWQRGPPPGTDDQLLATRAPVTSGFPASFTLRLYTPPPAEAFRALVPGAPSWARANAAAVPYGVAPSQIPELGSVFNASYTFDPEHWVMYLDAAVAPNSLTEWWLGGALGPGYHLERVLPVGCPTASDLEACVAELVRRGVSDDGTSSPGTARAYCAAPYRLVPTTVDDPIVLRLGQLGGAPDAGCP
jgi:hypothetical protein